MGCVNKFYFNCGCDGTDGSGTSTDAECCDDLNSELEKILKRLKDLEKKCKCDGAGGDDDDDGNDDTPPGGDADDGVTGPGKVELTLLGGTAADRFFGLLATEDGYIACGDTASAGAGSTDALLVKFSKDLGMLSKTAIGGTAAECFYSLVPTADGGCLATGSSASAGTSGGSDGWALSVDKNMAVTHSSLYGGSSWNEVFLDTTATPAGFTGSACYAAVGYLMSSTYYGLMVIYDKDLNVLKASEVNPSGGTQLYSVVATPNSFVTVGCTNAGGGAGDQDGLIIKYDPTLKVQKKILIGGSKEDCFTRIAKTATGYVVGGYTSSFGKGGRDILMLMLDEDLKIVNKTVIGGTGSDALNDLAVLPNGNFVITGDTTSVGAGGSDVLLMVLDKDLNIVKQLVFGGSGAETSSAVVANSNGSFTVAGHTPSAGAGGLDTFIATFKGDFADLTGGLAKYPALRINAGPGFTAQNTFTLTVNDNNTVPVADLSLPFKADPIRTVTTNPANLLVDANAVVAS